MPTYPYTCLDCRKRFEVFMSYSEYGSKPVHCKHCNSLNVQRRIGRVRIAQLGREPPGIAGGPQPAGRAGRRPQSPGAHDAPDEPGDGRRRRSRDGRSDRPAGSRVKAPRKSNQPSRAWAMRAAASAAMRIFRWIENLRIAFAAACSGLAVGDAVGTSVEFMPARLLHTPDRHDWRRARSTSSRVNGQMTHPWRCAWLASLVECRGFDARDQMERYWDWYRQRYASAAPGTASISAGQPGRR